MVSLAVELPENTRLTDSMPGLSQSYSLRKFPLVRCFLPHPGTAACGWRFSVLVLALALAGAAQAQSLTVLLERAINGVYTQRFNRRHGKVGHLFQGRFKAILVDRDAY